MTSCLWLSGCFVLDELDKGDALIEQHSVGWRAKQKREASEATTAAAEEPASDFNWKFWEKKKTDPTLREHLSDWWSKATEVKSATSDTDDPIVRCSIGEKVHFTRQSDCNLRRGRSEARPHKPTPAET